MNTYSPDRWVLVGITSKEHATIQKILAGWYGGFAVSDSWKLSLGNVNFIDKGEYYESLQESGSTYKLYKASEGFTGLTAGMFKHWGLLLEEEGCRIQQVDVKSAVKMINVKEKSNEV